MSGFHTFSRLSMMTALLLSVAVATGCDQEGPAEEAGEAIDNTVEDAGEAVD